MKTLAVGFMLALVPNSYAEVLDRIAIVIEKKAIKDSDIDRDVRMVSLLNGEPVTLNEKTRREAANRLIDQAIIRREIEVGEYSVASAKDADSMLSQVKRNRYKTEAQFEKDLAGHGLTTGDLRQYFVWQITVLRFIDQRFRPEVQVTDDEIETYFKAHAAELRQPDGKPDTLETATDEIRETLTEERVNQSFDRWLVGRRKRLDVDYLEKGIQ